MNEKNNIGESKPKQSRRQGESAPQLPVERAYAVEPLAVSKVLTIGLAIKWLRILSLGGIYKSAIT